MSSSEEFEVKPDVDVNKKELQHNIPVDDRSLDENSKPILHNGEPVITTGHDVSRFVVDIRDDGDTALTFRSIFLGTIFAGMSAALSQVSHFNLPVGDDSNNAEVQDTNYLWKIYLFEPVQMAVSRVFLMLLIYTIGNGWALFFPKRSWVVGTRLEFLAPVFNFINPGPFSIKEVINLAL